MPMESSSFGRRLPSRKSQKTGRLTLTEAQNENNAKRYPRGIYARIGILANPAEFSGAQQFAATGRRFKDIFEKPMLPCWLHVDRTAGRHRHHRDPGGPAVASIGQGQIQSTVHRLHEQLEPASESLDHVFQRER